jgi:hypothetical protein
MKLLYCPHCHDVRKLGFSPDYAPKDTSLPSLADIQDLLPKAQSWTYCLCGKSWGRYKDILNAVYGGDAVMLGFANDSLRDAIAMNKLRQRVSARSGVRFEAFIIPESAPTITRAKQGESK